MKLETLRVFNSVKCGKKELTFIRSDEYNMELVGQLVYITCKETKASVITPITNTPYFTELKPKKTQIKVSQGETKDEQSGSNKNSARVRKTKPK